jgi:hypothetical protein
MSALGSCADDKRRSLVNQLRANSQGNIYAEGDTYALYTILNSGAAFVSEALINGQRSFYVNPVARREMLDAWKRSSPASFSECNFDGNLLPHVFKERGSRFLSINPGMESTLPDSPSTRIFSVGDTTWAGAD